MCRAGLCGRGGGIFIKDSSAPILRNISISHNTAGYGCGICCGDSSNPRLYNVSITFNYTNSPLKAGAGIYCYGSSNMYLDHVILNNNTAKTDAFYTESYGGAICCSESYILFNHVILTNNKAKYGRSIACEHAQLHIVNSIIWNNSISIISGEPNIITISNSDVQGGLDSIISYNMGSFFWLKGNLDEDPMFEDVLNGDYQLAEGSPCIDAGIQDTFLVYNDNQDTVFIPSMSYLGSAPDIGAYESPYISSVKDYLFLPSSFSLSQNYPNPFNSSTTIRFTLPKSEFVTLKIYNILGQEIAELVSERLETGIHNYQSWG